MLFQTLISTIQILMTSNQPVDPAKLERLRQALEQYESGTSSEPPLFDRAAEEAKAKVRHRALLLLDHRARSRQEMQDRLIALDFTPDVVEDVIADLERDRLIDDALFAREWVRQRHQRRGKSKAILDRELRAKGIAASIRGEALDIIDEDDEQEKARELAVKKARSVKYDCSANRDDYAKALRRIVGVLARRGFPQGMSMMVARQALDQRLAELS